MRTDGAGMPAVYPFGLLGFATGLTLGDRVHQADTMKEDSFAFRLKELLEHKKLTLQAVATALGLSRPAIHKWTRGGEIDYDNLRKLAAFLNVNWIWLRYGEEAQREAESSSAVSLPMTDVRRKYTAEIMDSEARMKLAQEAARIVTWEWNLITDAVTYSPNVESVYGWPIASNADFWKRAHPEDIPMMERIYEDSLRTGEPHEFDFRILPPDGGIRWISSRATPIRDVEGRLVKMVGISMDSTARKAVEQSLRDQQARFRAVFELASEGMALIGIGWQWESVNAALTGMLGYSEAALAALTLPDLLAGDGEALQGLLSGTEDRCAFEARLVRKDGRQLPVSIRAALCRDEETRLPTHVIVAVQATGKAK
ncbi:hypothetical protein CS8_076920 [Cupriavidus sp. 8B]